MPDRLRYIDAVCNACKRIIRREEVVDDSADSVIQSKAEIAADGLIPFDYWTDSPNPVTGHTNGCKMRPN